ncbi:MAG: hypothetical protein HYZ01_02310 [Ignavibacteriales bacterium]|nr:hypothetical protein [Ignavibacteriales bacterium]
MKSAILSFCILTFLFVTPLSARQDTTLYGSWELVPQKSTDIDHFRTLRIDIRPVGDRVAISQTWVSRVNVKDSLLLTPGGKPVTVPVGSWVLPHNVFMGLRMVEGEVRTVSARWEHEGLDLRVEDRFNVQGSQGKIPLSVVHRYALSPEKEVLFYTVERATRRTGPEIKYVLKRAGTREAFVLHMEDNWEIEGKLPINAMLISLQGLANKSGPNVYALYQKDWPFTYVTSVFDFYKDRRYYTFRDLKTPRDAVRALKKYAKGYVVWDKAVRTSLIVAFTVAGLEEAVVVSEDQIPLMKEAGLNAVEDFRGKFVGKNDAQIYTWAYEQYWKRCSKEFIIWLGGEHGNMMRPAVADWGIKKQVFFNDLSSRPSAKEEYALADRLLSEMKPMSMVMGWHSYAKDLEEEHLTLTSKYGHRVEGLNSLPNLSFSSQIPVSPGFQFKNNHHVKPGETIVPQKKVYITCIQTDGIGLGAWLEPGRGEIPYAWEVLMNYVWMAPGMAEYFYTMATFNDYFIGCLSGPGYLYPKAVPPKYLPQLIALAREQMKILDLKVFETMDWSEGSEVEGNTDLTKSVMDEYYKGMPEAIGFVNGYGPGHTFTVREGRPWVSYDYYLSPERPEADAAADLQELATVNAQRPYFLLMHVREWSNIKRVKGILDRLGPEFEVVPLDVFLTMAGKAPTFKERFLPR